MRLSAAVSCLLLLFQSDKTSASTTAPPMVTSLPVDLQGLWRIDDSTALRVTTTQLLKEVVGDRTITETYNCISSFEEIDNLSHKSNYLVIYNVNSPDAKLCVKYKVDPDSISKSILVFVQTNVTDTSPTAETTCKNLRSYPKPYNVYIKLNSNSVCTTFDGLDGSYQAVVTKDGANKLCADDRDSLVHISGRDTLQMKTCVNDTSLPLKGSDLTCVGRLSYPTYVGSNAASAHVVIFASGNRYYCSRVLRFPISSDGRYLAAIVVSLDITNYTNGEVKCEPLQDIASSVAGQFIALTLTPYDCELEVCMNGAACTQEYESHKCQCPYGYKGTNCETAYDCDYGVCLNGATCTQHFESYTCQCTDGVKGTRCETPYDCDLGVCLNGATCTQQFESYTCQCPDGYKGTNCEIAYDCDFGVCLNGATCTQQFESYTCQCPDGYKGKNCETAYDCDFGVCLNGATCTQQSKSYTCQCPDGYKGTNCEIAYDCNLGVCMNGATCAQQSKSYTCQCPDGYKGKNCETAYDCHLGVCLNGANCTQQSKSYTCQCPDGYKGTNCQTAYDCDLGVCWNGATCTQQFEYYTCQCSDGYKGKNCETAYDCDLGVCLNGASCSQQFESYTCQCADGYKGTNCETAYDCDLGVCLNGATCTQQFRSYTCQCTDGYKGTNCGKPIFCVSNPCQNGATCWERTDSCRCPDGFTGTFCATDACASSPCKNGGTCDKIAGGYSCSCADDYFGQQCESELFCTPDPCQNGATCMEDTTSCSCADGFIGQYCRTDGCAPSLCQNGGTCARIPGGYSCSCIKSFTGQQCETHVCDTSICNNGGTCDRVAGGYNCSCVQGFYGDHCETQCNVLENPKFDVALVIDSSGSVTGEGYAEIWTQIKSFASKLITNLIELTDCNLGLLSYGHETNVITPLQRLNNNTMQTIINNLRPIGGHTGTAEALHTVYENIFTASGADRSDAPNYLILITDGNPTQSLDKSIQIRDDAIDPVTVTNAEIINTEVKDQAARLERDKNIRIIGVVVEGEYPINIALMKEIVTDSERDYFHVLLSDFKSLTNSIINDLSSRVCLTI